MEWATCEALKGQGRRAFVAEAGPWRTVFGLLTAEVLFAPVPGALPVPHLDRPVDLWRPGWVERREAWWGPLWKDLEGGRAVDRLRAAYRRWGAHRIVGVDTARYSLEDLSALLAGMSTDLTVHWMRDVLARGREAWRGAPDLVILPGPPIRWSDVLPAAIQPDLVLVELKGPGDSLRPGQAAWHDRWLRAGGVVERWDVAPASTS